MISNTLKNTKVTQSNSLDSLKRNSNTADAGAAPCKAKGFMLQSSNPVDGVFSLFRTFCKSYRCEYCGPRKALLMRSLIAKAISAHQLKVMATLTLDPRSCTAETSAKYIKKCWNKLRILQKRFFGKGLKYVSVLEYQKNGYAHLHVLFDQYIDQRWLKRAWASVSKATIVDIRKADERSSKYLCKYLVKTLTQNAGNNLRLIATSQDIKLKELLTKPEIEFVFLRMDQIEARNILKNSFHGDIKDRRGFVKGFQSTKPINVM